MLLTAYIISAADGYLVVGALELSALRAISSSLEDIADAIATEAARMTGRPPDISLSTFSTKGSAGDDVGWRLPQALLLGLSNSCRGQQPVHGLGPGIEKACGTGQVLNPQ